MARRGVHDPAVKGAWLALKLELLQLRLSVVPHYDVSSQTRRSRVDPRRAIYNDSTTSDADNDVTSTTSPYGSVLDDKKERQSKRKASLRQEGIVIPT